MVSETCDHFAAAKSNFDQTRNQEKEENNRALVAVRW